MRNGAIVPQARDFQEDAVALEYRPGICGGPRLRGDEDVPRERYGVAQHRDFHSGYATDFVRQLRHQRQRLGCFIRLVTAAAVHPERPRIAGLDRERLRVRTTANKAQ